MLYTIKIKAIQFRDFCYVTICMLYDIPTFQLIYEKIISIPNYMNSWIHI